MFTLGPDASNHWPYHLHNLGKVTDISKFVLFEIHASDIICKVVLQSYSQQKRLTECFYENESDTLFFLKLH